VDCPLHDERLTLAGLFFEAHTGLVAELERRLEADSGLTVQWFEVMLRLARSHEHRLRMSELAAQVSLTPSGLTRVIDRLEAEGYVKRGTCPGDRRGLNAILTPKGLKRVEAAVPKHIEHLEELFTGTLSDKERTALESALRKVRDTLNPCALVGTETPPR
jgi:DNA-binding MarR family transcriptional regulator